LTVRLTNNLRGATLLCAFITGLDGSASFFIFPPIRDNLANGDAISASWVLSIVSIVSAALLLQAGRLTDKYGAWVLYKFGISTYIFGLILCTIAPNLWFLVGARAVTAASGAIMAPSAIALLLRITEEGKKSESIGRWGFYSGFAGVAAPLLVTQLLEVFSWRLLFALQIPFGFLILLLMSGSSKFSPSDDSVVIRASDSVLTILGLTLLVLPIVKINQWGWSSWKTILSFLSFVLIFLWLVQKSDHSSSSPLPKKLFRDRQFVLASAMSFFAALAFFSHWLAPLLLMTEVWGYSLIQAGLLLTLMPATFAMSSTYFGKLSDRHGAKFVMVPGISIYCICFLVLCFLISDESSIVLLVPTLLISGIGMATIWPTLTSLGSSRVSDGDLGIANAVIHIMQRIGGGLGVALVLAIISSGDENSIYSSHRNAMFIIPVAAFVTLLCTLCLQSKQQDPIS
jgi:MFS family permease